MKNISYGSSAVTKSTESESKKVKEIKEVPAEITAKDILKNLAENKKRLEQLLEGTVELYHYYPNNEISTIVNSLEMVRGSFNKLTEKVEAFGK